MQFQVVRKQLLRIRIKKSRTRPLRRKYIEHDSGIVHPTLGNTTPVSKQNVYQEKITETIKSSRRENQVTTTIIAYCTAFSKLGHLKSAAICVYQAHHTENRCALNTSLFSAAGAALEAVALQRYPYLRRRTFFLHKKKLKLAVLCRVCSCHARYTAVSSRHILALLFYRTRRALLITLTRATPFTLCQYCF